MTKTFSVISQTDITIGLTADDHIAQFVIRSSHEYPDINFTLLYRDSNGWD